MAGATRGRTSLSYWKEREHNEQEVDVGNHIALDLNKPLMVSSLRTGSFQSSAADLFSTISQLSYPSLIGRSLSRHWLCLHRLSAPHTSVHTREVQQVQIAMHGRHPAGLSDRDGVSPPAPIIIRYDERKINLLSFHRTVQKHQSRIHQKVRVFGPGIVVSYVGQAWAKRRCCSILSSLCRCLDFSFHPHCFYSCSIILLCRSSTRALYKTLQPL
jgi:hypothetical protein